jgi:hypothetical protein
MSETEPEELRKLGDDIKKNGLRIPIAYCATKTDLGDFEIKLLDGRNRLDGMAAAGIAFWPVLNNGELSIHTDGFAHSLPQPRRIDSDPYDFVISTNIHRRHLTNQQKDDLLKKVIKATPRLSSRQIGRKVGVSHPHVAKVRSELEKTGDVETVPRQPTRRGASNRPASGRRSIARFSTR